MNALRRQSLSRGMASKLFCIAAPLLAAATFRFVLQTDGGLREAAGFSDNPQFVFLLETD